LGDLTASRMILSYFQFFHYAYAEMVGDLILSDTFSSNFKHLCISSHLGQLSLLPSAGWDMKGVLCSREGLGLHSSQIICYTQLLA